MALRFSGIIFRNVLRCSVKVHKAAPVENASWFLNTGGGFGCLRTSGQICLHFTPVCFIASEAVSGMLVQGKAVETHDSFCHRPASVPPNNAEQKTLLVNRPDQPENSKILKVAIIGAPNAGKSTLSNQLLGRKVFAVSKKVHTTRSRAEGVLTEDNTQIVLLDTPGLTTPSKVKRHQLERTLLVDPWNSVQEADLVVVLVDVSDKWACNKLDFEVLKCLAQNSNIPAVLVLNKVDRLKAKHKLLDITSSLTEGVVDGRKIRVSSAFRELPERRGLDSKAAAAGVDAGAQESADPSPQGPADLPQAVTDGDGNRKLSKEELRQLKSRQGWPHFRDVFMLSAVDAEEVEALKRYLVLGAKPGSWHYHSGVLTDQSPEDICTNAVREKLLEYLPQEVPYNVSQIIEMWQEGENGQLDISLKLYVKKEGHMKMLIGQAGQVIARIAGEAGEDLANVFLCDVRLKITVKVKK
ncbi:GTPase Era, mitochondrial [Anguilla rostrata]